ncbi:cyclic nucleotide-binding domain-containing protein [Candidatus Magnetominusculus dajiuhuensis]|uniref:cyclic nucleotide-binding domain-containing protein n=1 Tax=Candidatus Magnetominusculus dajiuhuensis TaxID=3137712 RepID=UPI003B42F1C6
MLILHFDQKSIDATKGILQYLGYGSITGVSVPARVFNVLKSEKFDLLFADFNTINMYEGEFLDALRENPGQVPVKVILLIDSEIAVQDLKKMYRDGITAIIKYPFQLNEMEKAIEDSIRSVPMAVSKTIRKIRELDFFSFLTDEELITLLKISKCRNYKENDIIFEDGQPGDRFYVIVDGIIVISQMVNKKREQVLARLKRGSCFGEMSILDGSPRTARAKAYDDTVLLEFDKRIMEGYDDIVTLKLFKKLTHIFSRRLRGANIKIKQMMADQAKLVGRAQDAPVT